jgi:hypothetical protein
MVVLIPMADTMSLDVRAIVEIKTGCVVVYSSQLRFLDADTLFRSTPLSKLNDK